MGRRPHAARALVGLGARPRSEWRPLASFFLRSLAARATGRPPVLKVYGTEMAAADLDSLTFLVDEIFGRRTYDVGPLPQCPVIVDCGANIGVAALYVARRYPGARIVAFEPDPGTFAILERNARSIGGVVCHQLALGRDDGQIELFSAGAGAQPLMMSSRPERLASPVSTMVPCRRLSTLLPEHVDLLKVDVEGMEWDLLAELEDSGAIARIDRIVVEYHHHLPPERNDLAEFLGFFDRNGFAYLIEAERLRKGREAFQDVMVYGYR